MFAIYYSCVFICFLASLFVYKYNKGLQIFPLMTGLIVVVEAIVGILSRVYVTNPFWLYHFFIPVYACFMAYFFYHIIPEQKTRRILLVAVAAYVLTSLYLSFFFYQFTDFPGLSLNMSGFILISFSMYALLTLESVHNIPIYKHPIAWICMGMIVFYTGTFFLNGVYNYLVVSKSQTRILIHSIINNGLNCFMYSCFTVGLICSHRLKKYTKPV